VFRGSREAMERPILVTGGAGYVGAHTCLALAAAGFTPVVYDDLSNGHADAVQWGPLERGDVRDQDRLDAVFAAHSPVAVMHFAALIDVAESVRQPERYYNVNVGGALAVIAAARKAGVEAIVVSSTCATFGEPERLPIDETHPQNPINPYGQAKLIVERLLTDQESPGAMRSAILRYFNAAGADPLGRIGERHDPETHAIPLAIGTALGRRPAFKVFGDDYETRDGTAERDYVHVLDLADAHVLALRRLLDGGDTQAFNLGSGAGTTVRELVAAVERAAGAPLATEVCARREGDAAMLVAEIGKARRVLGWSPKRDLDEIVQTAFAWHAGRPD
jgi:UDP-glucose 4-epimerase